MIDPANPDFSNTPISPQRPRFDYTPADVLACPALSIVTPFYNTGEIFHETARSVMQQTMQQFEWIIVNDGSTDAQALAILDSYRRRDPRIRVIDHAANKGLSAARNTGFQAAQTEFVVQLDSDDLLEPTAAEKWLWFLVSYPEYGFVKGYTVIFGARDRLHSSAFGVGAQFLTGNRVNPTAMIRRSVHQSVGGYDETIRGGLEDWEFWLRCANGGFWGGSMPEYLDWRRRRPDPGDHWENLSSKERGAAMHQLFKQRYARLWQKDGFPRIALAPQPPFAAIPDDLPCANPLRKHKPRLLMIVRCLAIGGGSKFQLDVVEQLAARGWEITIVTTDKEEHPWLAEYTRFTPDIFHLPHMARPLDFPRCLRYLAQSRGVDAILLTGSEIGYHLIPYLRARLPDTPLVDYCHFVEPKRLNGGFPRLSLTYQALLQGTGVSSHQLKTWMVENGGDPSKITVQHTNIDAQRWRPDPEARPRLRAELGIAGTRPVLVFVGRLAAQKQPAVLAQTVLRLKQRGCQFTLLVAGQGPDRSWLRLFIARHRLQKHMRLLGAVSSERIRQLLAASDIFFLPSQNEGVSLAVFEAMACGLPIISADVGGQSELVTPDCGILASPHGEQEDVQRYTDALADLLAHPERGRAMGAAARRRVAASFTIEQMADGIAALINDARPRCADPAARPGVGVGLVCATQAIEYMRLARETAELAARRQMAGGSWPRRALGRLVLWGRYPPARLAPVVGVIKRLIPVSIKSMLKRVFGLA